MARERTNCWVGALTGGFAALILATAAHASGRTDLAHLHAAETTKVPIGWLQFCQDDPRECATSGKRERPAALTGERWRELQSVNLRFNQSIEPMTDEEQYGVAEKWTYATTGKGDCEDYVLEKRRALTTRGWSLSQLLITVVLDKKGLGHAVLTVATDKGEYILDNQTDEVLPWSRTGLTFIKRQSPEEPNRWLDLGRSIGRPDILTAAPK